MTQTTTVTREQATYNFIVAFIKEHVYSPTLREIAEHLGTSTSMSTLYCNKLEQLELIQRTPRIARSIRVVG
jgi:SOS-response transcriptional repressor LexA